MRAPAGSMLRLLPSPGRRRAAAYCCPAAAPHRGPGPLAAARRRRAAAQLRPASAWAKTRSHVDVDPQTLQASRRPLICTGLGIKWRFVPCRLNVMRSARTMWATVQDTAQRYRWQCEFIGDNMSDLRRHMLWFESGLSMELITLSGDPVVLQGLDYSGCAKVVSGWEMGLGVFGVGWAQLENPIASGRPSIYWFTFTLGMNVGFRKFGTGVFAPVGAARRPVHRVMSNWSMRKLLVVTIGSPLLLFMVTFVVLSIQGMYLHRTLVENADQEFQDDLAEMIRHLRREILLGHLGAASHLYNLIQQMYAIQGEDKAAELGFDRERLAQDRSEGKLLDVDEDRFRIWGNVKSAHPVWGPERSTSANESPADAAARRIMERARERDAAAAAAEPAAEPAEAPAAPAAAAPTRAWYKLWT